MDFIFVRVIEVVLFEVKIVISVIFFEWDFVKIRVFVMEVLGYCKGECFLGLLFLVFCFLCLFSDCDILLLC